MTKSEVLQIIDEVMYNREIDSYRNAILAIRDKVINYPECPPDYSRFAKLELRGHNDLYCISPIFPEAKYVCIDTAHKIYTGNYGAYWFE